MEKLTQRLKGKKQLVFIDFEGTEKSHEIISIGAVKATLDYKGAIKKTYPSFYCLVKAQEPLTAFISHLTKIKQSDLDGQGLSLHEAVKKLQKYIGVAALKKTIILVFAPHDFRLLRLAAERLPDEKDKAIITQWLKNMLDFQAILAHLIQDPAGNPLSLNNYLKMFAIEVEGQLHHAEIDALKLKKLYEAFINPIYKNQLKEEYLAILKRGKGLPRPVQQILLAILKGETVSKDHLLDAIEQYIDA